MAIEKLNDQVVRCSKKAASSCASCSLGTGPQRSLFTRYQILVFRIAKFGARMVELVYRVNVLLNSWELEVVNTVESLVRQVGSTCTF